MFTRRNSNFETECTFLSSRCSLLPFRSSFGRRFLAASRMIIPVFGNLAERSVEA